MKATGIVRRIDDLGRVVIPKEIRRTLRIREGDPLEIYVDREGEVILKKYSPIGELSDFASQYAETLYQSTGHIALITDRDQVVAVAGASKAAWQHRAVSPWLERMMDDRRPLIFPADRTEEDEGESERWNWQAAAAAPVIVDGDPVGAVVLATEDEEAEMGPLELKLVEIAAGFLAKQMG